MEITSIKQDEFWNILSKSERYIVLLKKENNFECIIDFSKEDIKITSLIYESPEKMIVEGISSSLIDVVTAGRNDNRQELEHIARLTGLSFLSFRHSNRFCSFVSVLFLYACLISCFWLSKYLICGRPILSSP